MPFRPEIYTDPELIMALYESPTDSTLLAQFAQQTGNFRPDQFNVPSTSSGLNLGATLPLAGVGDSGGGGVSGGTGGETGGGGSGGQCFIGETEVTLFNQERKSLATMYIYRDKYLGKGVQSFTLDKRIMPGKILDITRNTVTTVLEQHFKGESVPMLMVAEHRFFSNHNRFKRMYAFRKGDYTWGYDGDWKQIMVGARRTLSFPDGIFVYNLAVEKYQTYFAAASGCLAKAVHNVKPSGDGGGFELQ